MNVSNNIEGQMENNQKKKMDGEVPETILLNITTNLNTSLVVVPSRSETIADIRATIRDYHRSLFPDFGEIDISTLEIQMFGGRSRLADPILIGQLFFKQIQAGLFAELSQRSGKEHPSKLLAEEVPAACDRDHGPLRSRPPPGQHTPPADELITSEEGQKRTVASSILPIGGSKRKTRESVPDLANGGVPHRGVQNADGLQDQVRKKRNVDECEKSNAGVNIHAIEHLLPTERVSNPEKSETTVVSGSSALEKANEEEGDAKARLHGPENAHLGEPSSELSPSKTSSIADGRKSRLGSGGREIPGNSIPGPSRRGGTKDSESDHPNSGEEPTKSGRVPPSPHGRESVTKRPPASESEHDSSSTDDSDSRSRPALPITEDNVLKRAGLEAPSSLDESARALADVASGRIAGSNDGSGSSDDESDDVKQEVHLATLAKLFEKDQGGGTPQAVESRPEASTSDTSSGNSSQSGRVAEPQVHSQQKGNARKVSPQAPGSSGKKLPSDVSQKVKVASKNGPSRSENGLSDRRKTESQLSASESSENTEDSGKESVERQPSKSKETVETDVNLSQLDVSSSSGQESESDGESDSDGGSEEDYAPEDTGDEETTDESSSGESEESEDLASKGEGVKGKDSESAELKTPRLGTGPGRSSSRRSGDMIDLKYQHVLDNLDGFHELVSLSQQKSKAPTGHQQKAQEAGDEIHELVGSAPFAVDSLAPSELADTQEAGIPGGDVGSQASKFQVALDRAGPGVKDGAKGAENLKTPKQGVSSSSKGGAGDNVSGQKGPSTGSASKEKLESGRVSPEARFDDSQIHAAEQLARMAKAGEDVVEKSPKPKRLRRKQAILPAVESTGLVIDIASDKDDPSLAGDLLPSQTSSEPALASQDHGGKTGSGHGDLPKDHKTIAHKPAEGEPAIERDNAHTIPLSEREGHEQVATEDDPQLVNGEASREKRIIFESGEVSGPRRKSSAQQLPSGDTLAKPKLNKSKGRVLKAEGAAKRDMKMIEEIETPGPEANLDQVSRGSGGTLGMANDIPTETHTAQGSKDEVTIGGKTSKKKRKTDESLLIHKMVPGEADTSLQSVDDTQEGKQGEKNVHLNEDSANAAEVTTVMESPDGKRRSRRRGEQTVDGQNVAQNLEPSPVKVSQRSSRRTQAKDRLQTGEDCNSEHLKKFDGPNLTAENAEDEEDTAQETLPPTNEDKAAHRVQEAEPTTAAPKDQPGTKNPRSRVSKRRKSQSKSVLEAETAPTHESIDLGENDDQIPSRDRTGRESPPQSPRPNAKKRHPKAKESELQLPTKSESVKEIELESPAPTDGGHAAQQEALAAEGSPESTRKHGLKGMTTKNGKRGSRKIEEDDEDKEDSLPERQVLPQKKKRAGPKTDGGLKQAEPELVQSSPDDLKAGDKQAVDTKKRKKGDQTEVEAEERPGACPWGCGKVYAKKTSSYFRHRKTCELCPPDLRDT